MPSSKQHTVLAFIKNWRSEKGVSPSLKEIAKEIGVTEVSAHFTVQDMQAENMLIVHPRMARGIIPTDDVAAFPYTPKQLEVLKLIAKGMKLGEIAKFLGIKPPSVSGRVESLAAKGALNRDTLEILDAGLLKTLAEVPHD